MRKAILLLVLVVVVVFGIAAASLRARVGAAAPALGRQIGEQLRASVAIGDVDVSLFPLAARIRDVRVKRPESVEPFLAIDTVRVGAALTSLFRGELDVRSLVLDHPTLAIVRDKDGRQLSKLSDDLLASLAKMTFSVRVVEGNVRFEDRFGDAERQILAERIHGTLDASADAGLVADLRGSVLGSSDDSTLQLELKPDVGARGGDQVKLALKVNDGRAEALKAGFALLRRAELTDPLTFEASMSGLLGEKSSEVAPAEPMKGTLEGSIGVIVAGVEERFEVEAETSLNDRRFEVRRGKGSWGAFKFEPAGWVMLLSPHKLSARLDFEPFELEPAAASFGFAERWQPTGTYDLLIRASGNADEVLVRHEGKIDNLELDAFPAVPIKASPVSVVGALKAINTDISASLGMTNLEVGTARLGQQMIGIDYWKGKLSVRSLDAPFYDGNALGSIAYEPAVSDDVVGGLMFRDSDVEAVAKNIVPKLPLDVYGRIDTILELRHDGEKLRIHGRSGIHHGRIAGVNWLRQLVSEALTLAGQPDALAPVAAASAATLSDAFMRFERIAVDFETGGGAVNMPRFVLTAEAAALRARGTIADDGTLSLDGTLLTEEELTKSLSTAAPALGSVKDAAGSLAIPFSLRASKDATRIEATPAYREAIAAAVAGRTVPPVEIVVIKPADFGPMHPLVKQFGR